MKRTALAIVLAGMMGVGVCAQISGSWSGELSLLPSVGLTESTLELSCVVDEWNLTGTAEFGASGTFDKFTVAASGALGAFDLDSSVEFDPTVPEFKKWSVSLSTSFAGITTDVDFVLATGAEWTFTVGTNSLEVEVVMGDETAEDTCFCFSEATLTYTGLGLCCASYDVELKFTDEGFDYVKFSFTDISIFAPISMDLDVEFGVDYKTVSPSFDLEFADACFVIYGDVVYDAETSALQGIEIYGLKLSCEFTECLSFETGTAFVPAELEDKFDLELDNEEYEYAAISFCGPGCCGGDYSVDLKTYFGGLGTLFDITRIMAETTVPLWSNFSISVSFANDLADEELELGLGWTFKF